jgi:hypothetical protein
MKFKARRRMWMGVAMLAGLAASANLAQASSIGFSSLQFISPVPGFASGGDLIVSSRSLGRGDIGTYTFGAELCQTGFCTGDTGSPSSQIRLTQLSLSCLANDTGGTCGPIDVTFEVAAETSPGSVPIDLLLSNGGLSGASSLSGYARVCIVDTNDLCSSDGSGTLSYTFAFGPQISGDVGTVYNAAGGFQVLGFFHLDGLADGATVTLGNSLELSAGDAVGGSGVPEPGTMVMLGCASPL